MSIFDVPEVVQPDEVTFEQAREKYYSLMEVKLRDLSLEDADLRFSTTIDLRKVREALVAIIGVGGLGNWQWRILASMGFKRIAVFDDDVVGPENIGPQAHSIFDLGMPKVEAVAQAAMQYRGLRIIAKKMRVQTLDDVSNELREMPQIIISCVDNMEFRKNFYYSIDKCICLKYPDLYIDFRMSLGDWAAYVIPIEKLESEFLDNTKAYREKGLFEDSEGLEEPCTARAISYTGANAASFTGALLHLFYSDPDDFYKKIKQYTSFSARDFEFITYSKREQKLLETMHHLEEEANSVKKSYKLLMRRVFATPQEAWDDEFYEVLECSFFVKYYFVKAMKNNRGAWLYMIFTHEMYLIAWENLINLDNYEFVNIDTLENQEYLLVKTSVTSLFDVLVRNYNIGDVLLVDGKVFVIEKDCIVKIDGDIIERVEFYTLIKCLYSDTVIEKINDVNYHEQAVKFLNNIIATTINNNNTNNTNNTNNNTNNTNNINTTTNNTNNIQVGNYVKVLPTDLVPGDIVVYSRNPSEITKRYTVVLTCNTTVLVNSDGEDFWLGSNNLWKVTT